MKNMRYFLIVSLLALFGAGCTQTTISERDIIQQAAKACSDKGGIPILMNLLGCSTSGAGTTCLELRDCKFPPK